MARNYCCFKGRGEVLLADYAAYLAKTIGLVPAGNAPTLSVAVSETVERVKDYTTPAGGTDCSSREIDSAEVSLSLKCHNLAALNLSLYGSTEQIAEAAVASEDQVLFAGAVVPLNNVPDLGTSIVVTSLDAQPVTYALGTDYEITPAGSIKKTATSTIPEPTITAGKGVANIRVSYKRAEQLKVQLMTRPTKPVTLHFDGVNLMDALRPAHFDLFKVQFGPAASVQMISDNSGTLELKGELMRDPTRPAGTLANPFSQYGTLRI